MSTPTLGYPFSLSMARSPIFITGKNNTLTNDSLDEMSLDLRIYSGAKTLPATNDYSLSKNYSIDEVINFEISDLVRDQFSHDFSVWNDIGFSQSPNGEVLWVAPLGSWTYSNNGAAPESGIWSNSNTYAFLVTDGWAAMTNIAPTSVTQAVLATSRDRQVLQSNYETLAVYNSVANDIGSIQIVWNNGASGLLYTSSTSTSLPDPASNNTRDFVIYAGVGAANLQNNTWISSTIKPSAHDTGDYYDVNIRATDNTTIASVRYYLVCEPRYTPYQIAFINRFGVADFMTFFKRSDERGTFTQDSYQKSIYNDAFTSPSLEIGKYQSFNVNSRNNLTLNTGFVDEDYDEAIKDILMSEYVAVLENGSWISVVPERGSVDYQKHVNQRLINYTLTFTYGFDERSLVR